MLGVYSNVGIIYTWYVGIICHTNNFIAGLFLLKCIIIKTGCKLGDKKLTVYETEVMSICVLVDGIFCLYCWSVKRVVVSVAEFTSVVFILEDGAGVFNWADIDGNTSDNSKSPHWKYYLIYAFILLACVG